MAELNFGPEADEVLTRLENDPTTERCAERLNSALDLLAANPGDAHNRRRRFAAIGVWAIAVVCGDDEWLILWEPGDGDDVTVHHIVSGLS